MAFEKQPQREFGLSLTIQKRKEKQMKVNDSVSQYHSLFKREKRNQCDSQFKREKGKQMKV